MVRESPSVCAFIEDLDRLFRINYGTDMSDRKRTKVHKIMSGSL